MRLIQKEGSFKLFVLKIECVFKVKLQILHVEVIVIYQAKEYNILNTYWITDYSFKLRTVATNNGSDKVFNI
jgi:hypothetical protein